MQSSDFIAIGGVLVALYSIYVAGQNKKDSKLAAAEKENINNKFATLHKREDSQAKDIEALQSGRALIDQEQGEMHTKIAVLEERCKSL